MKNKLEHYAGNIFIAQYGKEIDVDLIQKNLIFLADKGVCTFGNISTEILRPILEDNNFKIERNDLCFEDDLTLGLQMPDTWYLNRGSGAISISMYYNFLNYKEMAKGGVLFTKNKEAFDSYGRTGIVEVYLQDNLEKFLLSRDIDYFGTPKTLTECMRVLEGWDINRLPRLKSYVPYSEFIKIWCNDYYPNFKESEWGLGEVKSKMILNGTGTTNVRESIKFFWQNYLLKKSEKISSGDIEIDILSRHFYGNRKPDYILIGEDIFTEDESIQKINFKEFTTGRIIEVGHSSKKNEKDMATALITEKLFPEAKIIIFRNTSLMSNFTMCKLDEIKKGVNREVGVIAEVLVSLINESKK
jgi:hypothetical protein